VIRRVFTRVRAPARVRNAPCHTLRDSLAEIISRGGRDVRRQWMLRPAVLPALSGT